MKTSYFTHKISQLAKCTLSLAQKIENEVYTNTPEFLISEATDVEIMAQVKLAAYTLTK
jgi:hypothetical protein